MPNDSRSTRTACGCRCGLGLVPALAVVTRPAVWWRSRASAIGERALFPVHTKSTAGRWDGVRAAGRRGSAGGSGRNAGCRAAPLAASP